QDRSLFPVPRWATKETRDTAIAALLGVREGGPSELGRALSYALAVQDTAPRHRTIVMLTDGHGARGALDVAARDQGPTRVFTVGFGASVDRPALSRLASLKRGRFTFVENAEALPGRVDRLSRWIAAPGLTHLSLTADGGALREVYPRVLPDLYP